MRAHEATNARIRILQGHGCQPEEVLLSRWAPDDRKFVLAQFDRADPLDAALVVELLRFRPGIDEYDA
jgi:hypothetical protein